MSKKHLNIAFAILTAIKQLKSLKCKTILQFFFSCNSKASIEI